MTPPRSAQHRAAHVLRLLGQAILLTLVYLVGTTLVSTLHLPVPGNVVGLLILLGLLASGAVRPSQIDELCSFVLKHMAFFFCTAGRRTHDPR